MLLRLRLKWPAEHEGEGNGGRSPRQCGDRREVPRKSENFRRISGGNGRGACAFWLWSIFAVSVAGQRLMMSNRVLAVGNVTALQPAIIPSVRGNAAAAGSHRASVPR